MRLTRATAAPLALAGATVVGVFVPSALNAEQFVSSDCIHPSGTGFLAIETLVEAAFLQGE